MIIKIVNYVIIILQHSINTIQQILHWLSINISVAWLSFFIALAAYLRNNGQKFRYLFEEDKEKITITLYNDSVGTETVIFDSVAISSSKNYIYRKLIVPNYLKHANTNSNSSKIIFLNSSNMMDRSDEQKKQEAYFDYFSIKIHMYKRIELKSEIFVQEFSNLLMSNQRALNRFRNKKEIYFLFLFATMSGQIKVITISINPTSMIAEKLNKKLNKRIDCL